MVEKKLNFNQPILSVRRCSVKMPSKTKNVVPEMNSGPVAVPFQWEQIPGKPKEETKRQPEHEMKDEDCDEIDYLSRTESFISSCSMSSLNGADDDDDDSSRTSSMDPPQVKKEVVVKQEKQVCDDHDHDQDEKLVTVCCLLPRSCFKSSVCYINPAPATSFMGRFAVFPSTGILSRCSSADSMSEAENEDSVKSVVETDGNKANVVKDIARLENCDGALSFVEGSFKTLQELLADEDKNKKELETDEDIYVDSRKRNEEKQKLSRCKSTLGNSRIPRFPIPPPLPRSPSDSWLFRTMSTNKASRASFLSRCTKKS